MEMTPFGSLVLVTQQYGSTCDGSKKRQRLTTEESLDNYEYYLNGGKHEIG